MPALKLCARLALHGRLAVLALCSFASVLAPGTAAAATAAGTTITNIAQVAWTVGAGTLTSAAQNQVTVAPYTLGPDLAVSVAGPAQAAPGTSIIWKAVVSNSGPGVANGAQVVATLPPGVTGISGSCAVLAGGTCGAVTVGAAGAAGTPVTIDLPGLPVGGSVEITLRGAAPVAPGVINTSVQASVPSLVDPTPGNNMAAVQTQVLAGAANTGSVSGHVWLDVNHDRQRNPGETLLQGVTIHVYDAAGTTLLRQSATDASGAYTVAGLPAGVSYQLEFRDVAGNTVFGLPVTAENGGAGFASTAVCSGLPETTSPNVVQPAQSGICYSLTTGGSSAQVQRTARILIQLQPGDNVVEQSLPLDPSGVIYDSVTRQPVAGATVTLNGPPGFDPALHVAGGAANQSQITGAAGYYQFLLVNGAPAGTYTLAVVPPAGYTSPSALIPPAGVLDPTGLGSAGVFPVQVQAAPPSGAQPTTYHLTLALAPGDPNVVNNHIPIDPAGADGGALVVRKAASKNVAGVGDFVQYRLTVANPGVTPIARISVSDRLPPGFRYRAGSAQLNGAPAPNPAVSADGRTLTFSIGVLAGGASQELRYVTEITVGASLGAAVNSAQAAGAGGAASLVARAVVEVKEDLFRSRSILLGRVIEVGGVDSAAAAPCGPEQYFGPGVEGARVFLEDGTYVRTDKEGKWHVDGIKPGTHVVQLDVKSLPEGYQPVLCEDTSRHAGRAFSQFVNVRGGTMWRADFYVRKVVSPPRESEVEHRLSATPVDAGARVVLELRGDTLAVRNITETVLLPDGLEYQPGSLRIDGQTAADPQVSGNALTFRLGGASGKWAKSIEFEARGRINREMQVRAGGQIQTVAGDTHRLPIVGAEFPQAPAAFMEEAKAVEPVVSPAALPVERVTLAADTHFAFGSAEFSSADRDDAPLAELKTIAERIRATDGLRRVRVTGHTDRLSRSGPDFNKQLSEARAQTVAKFLVQQGVDATLIEVIGAGDSQPVVDCPGPRSEKLIACLAANRRVESRVEIEIVRLPPPAAPVLPAEPARTVAPAAHAKREPLPPISSVRYVQTDADHRAPTPAAKPAVEPAKAGLLNIYAPGSEQFDAKWLASAKPGFEIVYPQETFIPGINATKVIVKFDPAHKVTLSVNGVPVHALNFDGTEQNPQKSIAVSRWGGVGLQDGPNKIVATAVDASGKEVGRVERMLHYSGAGVEGRFVPEASTLIADGRTTPVIAVRIFDRDGKPARHGTEGELKISAPYQSLEVVQRRDSRPLLDDIGNQARWRVTDDGLALIRLQPTTTSGEVVLTFNFPGRTPQLIRAWLKPELREWILVGFGEGTIGERKLSGAMEELPSGMADDKLWQDGRVAFYAKGQVKGEYLLTIAYDTDKERRRTGGNLGDRLGQTLDRKQYYTIYGDATSPQYDAASTRKLYLKIEKSQFYAMFGDFDTGLSVTELTRYTRTINGVKSEFRGENISYTAFATQTAQAFVKDELRPDGTSGLYRLTRGNILPNSEKVRVETRDRFRSEVILKSEPLSRGLDYEVDYTQGTLFFRTAIPGKDQNFNPIYIIVDYESADPTRDERPTGGARVALRTGDGKAEVGLSAVHEGTRGARGDLRGADATYEIDAKTRVRAEYAQSRREVAGADATGDAYLLELRRQDTDVAAAAYLRRQDGGFGLGQQAAAQSGTTKAGGEVSVRVNQDVRVDALSLHERIENPGAEADRTRVEARASYVKPEYSAYAGGRAVRDHTAAGETRASNQLVAGGSYKMMDGRLNLRLDSELNVGGGGSVDFPHRQRIGADYKWSEATTVFADQEFANGERERASTTRVGVKSRPWDGGETANSFNFRQTPDGPTASTTSSITQTMRVSPAVTVNAGLDRTTTLSKPGDVPLNANVPSAQGFGSLGGAASQSTLPPVGITATPVEDYTAVFAGATWNDGPWGATARGEYRQGDITKRINLAASVHRDLAAGEALAATALYISTKGGPGGGNEGLDLRLSYALRPIDSLWIVLNRLDYIQEESDATGGLRSRRLVNNTNVNYRYNRRTQIGLQFGAKYVLDSFDRTSASGFTDLYGVEVRYDLGNRFDIGAHAGLLHSWESHVTESSYGLSVGYSPVTNLWLGVGYNFAGFRDRDFTGATAKAKGWYLYFRVKADQGEKDPELKPGLVLDEKPR